jgi:hypothetical protein
MSLSPDEAFSIRAFRRIADELRPLLIEHGNFSIALQPFTNKVIGGIPESAVKLLLMGVRKAYLQEEATNIRHVHNIVHRHGHDEAKRTAAGAYQEWRLTLKGLISFQPISGVRYSGEDVLKTFLYTRYFHSDRDRAEDARNLSDFGDMPHGFLQVTAVKLASCIVVLASAAAHLEQEA